MRKITLPSVVMPTSHLAKSSFLRMLFPPSFREVEVEHLMRMWQGKSALSVRKELIYSSFSYYLVRVFYMETYLKLHSTL